MGVCFVINYLVVYLYFVYFFVFIILYKEDVEINKCLRVVKEILNNKKSVLL